MALAFTMQAEISTTINMMKYLIVFLSLFISVTAMGIPAKRLRQELTLTDGTKVWATLTGDEYGHWYEGDDGSRYLLNNDGTASMMDAGQTKRLVKQRSARMAAANERRSQSMSKLMSHTPKQAPLFSGSKKGLVILVNFADKKMSAKGTNSEFNNMFNKPGYSSNNHVGSVHDYFSDNSYGSFNLTFDIVGPVTVSKNMSYYGNNDRNGNDSYPATMVIEACKEADKYVNFRNYDWDGDGYVDQVFVIYAGYGEHAGAPSSTIWPHEYNLYSANYFGDGSGILTLDGMKINTYAVTSELAGNSGTTLAGIGTACHEFSHCLTLPDTYDTDYSGGQGMMNWGLMCSGSYNGQNMNGERPAALTAFERLILGWIDPIELTSPCYISDMPAISDSPTSYIIWNTSTEFYMLENRQNGKWDYYTNGKFLGHGLFVTHIDYDTQAWATNKVNDVPSHQRMTFIPADNSLDNNYQGDTYPGTRNNTKLTDTSLPAARVYSGGLMGKPITDITEKNGRISFSFMGGSDEGTGGSSTTTSVTIPTEVTTYVGTSTQIKVTVSPSGAQPKLNWFSSNTEVATVNENGYVSGISEGTTVIYCQTDQGIKSNNCVVTVTSLQPQSISITPSYIYLPIGQSRQLEYHLQPWNAVTSVIWRNLSAKGIINLSEDGIVTAIGPGTGLVDVQTSNYKFAEPCEICVPPNAESIELPEMTRIALGQSMPLDISVVPQDGYYEGTWTSADNSIVLINEAGHITALKEGSTTVQLELSTGEVLQTLVQVFKPEYFFIVVLHNGDNIRFEIQSTPMMERKGSNIVFTTKNEVHEYSAASVHKMIMIDADAFTSLSDLNGDGRTSISDLSELLRQFNEKAAKENDLNFDGILDAIDAKEMVRRILESVKQ